MRTVARSSFVLIALFVLAAGAAPAGTPVVPARARPVGPTAIVLPVRDPMAVEMQREIDARQEQYAALYTRLAQARDEREAFAIQEELRQGQTGLQIALLRIQAAYAERAGRTRLQAQLERAIDVLISPER